MDNIKPVYWYLLAMVISLSLWGLVIICFMAVYEGYYAR